MSNLFLCSFYLPNTYRLTGTSGKTFFQVLSAAELLKKYKVDFNILTVG